MSEDGRGRESTWILVGIGATAIGAVPFWFIGRPEVFWLGIPVWLWSSFGFTAATAGITAYGIHRLWRGEDRD